MREPEARAVSELLGDVLLNATGQIRNVLVQSWCLYVTDVELEAVVENGEASLKHVEVNSIAPSSKCSVEIQHLGKSDLLMAYLRAQ